MASMVQMTVAVLTVVVLETVTRVRRLHRLDKGVRRSVGFVTQHARLSILSCRCLGLLRVKPLRSQRECSLRLFGMCSWHVQAASRELKHFRADN
eukprot:119518-Pleurochrysis_carterae.AAC.3